MCVRNEDADSDGLDCILHTLLDLVGDRIGD